MAYKPGLVPVIPASPLNLSMVGTAGAAVAEAAVLQTYSVWTAFGSIAVTEDSARVAAVGGTAVTMETT